MTILKKKLDANQYNLKDQVVAINRVTKVVKGGKNMSFAALVVVGDPGSGVVGYGSGKAKEVPQAIRKGIESAKKNLVKINLTETTIPHQVLGRFGSGQVLLKPAPEGTGVIAGAAVQINVLVNGAFASGINGGRSWLACAFRLMQFPIGVFGVAIVTSKISSYFLLLQNLYN